MSMIPAQMPSVGLRVAARAPARRWPLAVGLGAAGLVSAGLWIGLIALVRHLF